MNREVPDPPERILIVKPSSLGDIVHALPVAAALHERWPAASLAWMIRPEFAPVLEGNPSVQRLIPFPREDFRGPAGWLQSIGWTAGLRRLRSELTVDLQGLFRSGLFARTASRGCVVGMSDAREGSGLFYDRIARIDPRWHSVDRYLGVLEAIDLPRPAAPAFELPEGTPPESKLPTAFLLLHPFSRGVGKSLPPELVRQLIARSPLPVVVAGRTAQTPELPGAANLLNRTSIPELLWLLRQARAVISVDSGPMHLAAVVSRNLLSIHSWTDPLSVGPYRPEASVWKNGGIRPVGELSDAHRAPGRALQETDLPDLVRWIEAAGT